MRVASLVLAVWIAACGGGEEGLGPYPAPGEWPANSGPGAPAVGFAGDELMQTCAFLDGGPADRFDHHNLVTMFDGYLLMPWAPEWGNGGLTLWDISDPCNPVERGAGLSTTMRETHSIGFSKLGGRWAVVNQFESAAVGGIQFWDLSDSSAPEAVADLPLPDFLYPDSYARVVFSVFWQAPYVYVGAADTGVHVVDATDPTNPEVVGLYRFEPTLRAGQVQAIGNLLIVTASEGARTVLLDIGDPVNPQPIPGGDFLAHDGEGNPREAYFTNTEGGYVYYARKDGGGGLIMYDVTDPENPTFAGDIVSEGNGGYVFVKDRLAFVGQGDFASIYDTTDPSAITEVGRLDMVGDLDTVTPIGNVAVLSVDDEAEDDKGSSIAPYAEEADTRPPTVTFAWPPDGAVDLPLTSRFGVTLSEFVDESSAWVGSVRLYETGTDPDETRVEGTVSAQEVIVNFAPLEPLEPDTDYTLEIPAGGIVDYSGNPIEEPFTATFRTAGG